MKEKIKKLQILFDNLKNYFKILTDFQTLNKYVYYSSIFIDRVDKIIYSDFDDETILNNIRLSYSDFKIEYIEDFETGFSINNKFERSDS